VANTWTKITASYVYAMGTNGEEPENPSNLSVAATLEKANTYVFAERPFRNAEAVGSTLLCSTNTPDSTYLRAGPIARFLIGLIW
jgi:hypothetical protein